VYLVNISLRLRIQSSANERQISVLNALYAMALAWSANDSSSHLNTTLRRVQRVALSKAAI